MSSVFKISLVALSLFVGQNVIHASLMNDQEHDLARPRSLRQILEARIQNYEQQLVELKASNGQKRNVVAKSRHINAMIMGLNADLKILPVEAVVEPRPVVEPAPQPLPGPVIVCGLESDDESDSVSVSSSESGSDSDLDSVPTPPRTPEPIVQPGIDSDSESDSDSVSVASSVSDSYSELDREPSRAVTPELAEGGNGVIDEAHQLQRAPVQNSYLTSMQRLANNAYGWVQKNPRLTALGVASASVLLYSKYTTGSWFGLFNDLYTRVRKSLTADSKPSAVASASGASIAGSASTSPVTPPRERDPSWFLPPVVEGPIIVQPSNPKLPDLAGNSSGGFGLPGGSVGGNVPPSGPLGTGSLSSNYLGATGQGTEAAVNAAIQAAVENTVPLLTQQPVIQGLKSLGNKLFAITIFGEDGNILKTLTVKARKLNFGTFKFDTAGALEDFVKKATDAGAKIVSVVKGDKLKFKIIDQAGKVLDKMTLIPKAYKKK